MHHATLIDLEEKVTTRREIVFIKSGARSHLSSVRGSGNPLTYLSELSLTCQSAQPFVFWQYVFPPLYAYPFVSGGFLAAIVLSSRRGIFCEGNVLVCWPSPQHVGPGGIDTPCSHTAGALGPWGLCWAGGYRSNVSGKRRVSVFSGDGVLNIACLLAPLYS